MTQGVKPSNEEQASLIVDELPTCEEDSDLISLCDIVITAIQVKEEWNHWWVHKYDPMADGVINGWAVLAPLPSAGTRKPDGSLIKPVELFAGVVRKGVYEFLLSRLNAGMDLAGARHLVDGSYTDEMVADSIIQFILYGKEVFS